MKVIDVIKYEGDNKTFVWKYPGEDFNTSSKLIVDESQEALFYMDGKALDLYGKGEHILNTKNIPLLNKIINIPTGGDSSFHCHVYFINKTEQMAIKWGMGNVNFLDPTYNNYAFKIGASGEMSLSISDSRKIVTKLVGTEQLLDQDTVKNYFKAPITMHIKSLLPNILRERNISIFEVESKLTEISELLKEKISKEIDDYGIVLEKFWISTILVPESDPYYITLNKQRAEKIAIENQGELDIQRANIQRTIGLINHSGENEKKRMDIDTKRYENEQLGITETQREGFNVLTKLAENEGTGSDLRNAAIGAVTGIGIAGTYSNMLNNLTNNAFSSFTEPSNPTTMHNNLYDEVPGMINLKQESTSSTMSSGDNDDMNEFKTKIEKLKIMKESGCISEDEFEEHKNVILNEIINGGTKK